jgi:O-antigen/teichoic acid export membrane protein
LATSTPSSAERNPLPEGTLSVGAGLIISGITAYAFLWIIGKAITDHDQLTALQALWFGTFALAPGFFLPLEQEVGRALSHRLVLGEGGRPVIYRAATLGAVLAGLLLTGLLIASPVLVRSYFHHSTLLFIGLMLAVVGWAFAHLTRGVLSGNRRFGRYGIVFGADGIIRVIACIGLWIVGVNSAGPYGILIGAPPFIAAGIALFRQRGLREPGPEAPWSEVTANLGWLLIGSAAAAFLLNAGPLAAKALSDSDQNKLVSDFSYGVLVTRVPLFMFQAVQAALLPKLARLAAAGRMDEFRAGFRKLMVIVAGVAVIGTLGAFAVGPPILKLVFGARLGRTDLTLLALAAGLYMIAMALGQAVIALHGHAKVAVSWAIGLAAFGIGLVLHDSLLPRVELALTAAAAASTVALAISLRLQLSGGWAPDTDSMFEAALEVPFER